jgi:hypothetical protein
MRYLKGTAHYKLCFAVGKYLHILKDYADANHVGDLDDHKSKSGCIVFLNGAPTTWITQKQECVASSTMETEYMGICSIGSKRSIIAMLTKICQVSTNLTDNYPW